MWTTILEWAKGAGIILLIGLNAVLSTAIKRAGSRICD